MNDSFDSELREKIDKLLGEMKLTKKRESEFTWELLNLICWAYLEGCISERASQMVREKIIKLEAKLKYKSKL